MPKLTWADIVEGTKRAAKRAEEFRKTYQNETESVTDRSSRCGDTCFDWICGLPKGHEGRHKTWGGGSASWGAE